MRCGIKGVGTTNTDRRRTARSTRVGLNLNTSRTSLKHLVDTGGNRLGNSLITHGCHGTGKVGALHCSITDDHHLLKRLGVFLHHNVELTLVAHGELLVEIADVRQLDDRCRLGIIDREVSIKVGNGYRLAVERHRNTNHRITVSIRYITCYCLLGFSHEAAQGQA